MNKSDKTTISNETVSTADASEADFKILDSCDETSTSLVDIPALWLSYKLPILITWK